MLDEELEQVRLIHAEHEDDSQILEHLEVNPYAQVPDNSHKRKDNVSMSLTSRLDALKLGRSTESPLSTLEYVKSNRLDAATKQNALNSLRLDQSEV